jgi:hypothetical protein
MFFGSLSIAGSARASYFAAGSTGCWCQIRVMRSSRRGMVPVFDDNRCADERRTNGHRVHPERQRHDNLGGHG